jgi:protein SCO1/2
MLRSGARDAALFLLAIGCAGTSARRNDAGGVGQPAPLGVKPGSPATSLFDRDWVWEDDLGSSVRFSAWRGKLLVVGLVYTSCTTVCPLSIEKMRQLSVAFEREGRAAEFVLVTLDPMNDTVAQLVRFKEARNLPRRWHLVRGSQQQTDALADALRFKTVTMGDHVVHEAKIVLVDGRGRVMGYLHG